MFELPWPWMILWAGVGILCLLRWLFTQPEVTLLDLSLCVVLGFVCGPILPMLKWLDSVKIKGGQHGTNT